MMTLIVAAALAAQPTPASDIHAQHEQQGQAVTRQPMMVRMQMADCKKCCEQMEKKQPDDRSKQSEHGHQ